MIYSSRKLNVFWATHISSGLLSFVTTSPLMTKFWAWYVFVVSLNKLLNFSQTLVEWCDFRLRWSNFDPLFPKYLENDDIGGFRSLSRWTISSGWRISRFNPKILVVHTYLVRLKKRFHLESHWSNFGPLVDHYQNNLIHFEHGIYTYWAIKQKWFDFGP